MKTCLRVSPVSSFCCFFFAAVAVATAREYHVSPSGNNAHDGSAAKPLQTISAAAQLAQPGDTITVHAGTYRERINPPRGGTSDTQRITYRAAPDEKVEIKGSEVVKGWNEVQAGLWKVTLPNSLFGPFNPYADLIRGDWFNPKGREHHTGAVYINGEWLSEAAKLDHLLNPASRTQPTRQGGVLINVAWLRPGTGDKVPAVSHAAQSGVKNAPCTEGGECIGWIEDGDWVRYDNINFGARTDSIEVRAASLSTGGIIEFRRGSPTGELLGTCNVAKTGNWQSWTSFTAQLKPLSGVQTLCLLFRAPVVPAVAIPSTEPLWFAQVEKEQTTLWAQFNGADLNRQLVEINVRQTVFYPTQPGRNFITVRGFVMRHAATPWAPPTAEQIGLIGTHWSKGWIIEDNTVSHSICSGIALGKHGDKFDNTSANTAEGYVKTIERGHAHAIPWTKANIGHHVVRNNHISHCEQTGIVGSLGPVFCQVTGNTIHDIHVRRLFTGAEMAGIKFHAAIDTEISGNHIYRTCRGLWLDWMAQGTRVSRNLFHDNAGEDLFVEVDHGPFMVDNNIFLSPTTLLDMSQGGAYAHNLIAGKIISTEELRRDTPYHPTHSTTVAGLAKINGGDNRYYNNLFIGAGVTPVEIPKTDERHRRVSGYGLWVYDIREHASYAGGNVYLHGARPYSRETGALSLPQANPQVKLVAEGDRFFLQAQFGTEPSKAATRPVTTALLGQARIPNLPYENPDGSPLAIDIDYFGKKRDATRPTAGPFEAPASGALNVKVW